MAWLKRTRITIQRSCPSFKFKLTSVRKEKKPKTKKDILIGHQTKALKEIDLVDDLLFVIKIRLIQQR